MRTPAPQPPPPNDTLNPLHWTDLDWTAFFWVMALWNLAGSAAGLMRPATSLRLFFGFARDDSLSRAQQQLLALGPLLFGVGYAIAATDPRTHSGLILLGAIGKLTTLAAIGFLYTRGRATKIAFAAAMTNGFWVALFGLFLFGNASA